ADFHTPARAAGTGLRKQTLSNHGGKDPRSPGGLARPWTAEARGHRARRRLTSSVPVMAFNFLRPRYGGRGIIAAPPPELPTLGQQSSVADGPGVPARHGDRG